MRDFPTSFATMVYCASCVELLRRQKDMQEALRQQGSGSLQVHICTVAFKALGRTSRYLLSISSQMSTRLCLHFRWLLWMH